VYRIVLTAAREAGIGRQRLPDFLDLEDEAGDFVFLGQDEVWTSAMALPPVPPTMSDSTPGS